MNNDFTTILIIWKLLTRQRWRQKRKTMRKKGVEAKEGTAYKSNFIQLNK